MDQTRQVMRRILTEAEPAGSVVERPVYHGSDAKFEKFKRIPSKRYILFSEFDVKSPAFFFSPTVEDAKEFGPLVTAWQITVRNPLFNFEANPRLDSEADEEKAEHLRYILEPMIYEKEGKEYIDLGVSRYDVNRSDEHWGYVAVDSGGINWDVMDNDVAVARMIELGYDGTTVSETHASAGYSWAIFSPEQAAFLGEPE